MRRDRREQFLQIAAALVAVATGIATSFSLVSWLRTPSKTVLPESRTIERIQGTESALNDLQKQLKDIRTRIDSLSKPPQGAEWAPQFETLNADIKNLDDRLKLFEDALGDSSRALSVPLLRQDLQNLKNSYQKDIDTSAKQIDRIYDQNKWFIGLMLTMAIGLISLAVSSFLQARKKSD
jgi:DNA repair exonuclease SbcCD ATPase subunit